MSVDEQKHLMNKNVGEFGGKASLSHPSVVWWLNFSAAAAISKTAVAPIDRIKLLLQNERGMIVEGRLSEPYKGIRNCLVRTTMEEGFASLWRGNVANLIRYVPAQALNLGLWDFYKRMYREMGAGRDEVGSYLLNLCPGMWAGLSTAALVYPMDYARTRLALDTKMGGAFQYRGLGDLCRKTLAADGITGFYRGFALSFITTGGYRSFYFGTYESLKLVVLTGKMQDSFFGRFALAWASATFAGSLMYAFDTIRRRSMMMSGGHISPLGSIALLEKEAVSRRCIFSGIGLNIPRSVVGAAMLAAYDVAATHSITK